MKKNIYLELKEKQQKEVNDLPIYWAFGQQQYNELLKKLNKTDEEIKNECFSIFGGLAFESDKELIFNTFKKHDEEMKKNYDDNKFLYDAIYYELSNHEYIVTYNIEQTLGALGLTINYFDNEEKTNILNNAINDYTKDMKELGW